MTLAYRSPLAPADAAILIASSFEYVILELPDGPDGIHRQSNVSYRAAGE
jgi:hypothetical protein